jgi:peptide/nickel transport system substrate-binding protein
MFGQMMRRRRHVIATAAAALAALAIAGCGGSSSGSGGSSTALRLGVPEVPIESINWFNAASLASYNLLEAVYPTLVQFDGQLKPVGDLAQGWTVSKDGKTWTFKLHAGATWSDGKPLTADDVVWTCQTILKYAKGPSALVAFLLAGVQRCDAPNPTTVVLHTAAPNAAQLNNLSEFFVLPRHVWEAQVGRNGLGLKTYAPQNQLPLVAGGPFTVTQYAKDGTTILKRNPRFYGPTPHTSVIGWEFFSDTDGMIAALKSGDLDGVYWVPPQAAKTLRGQQGIHVTQEPGVPLLYLTLNAWPQNTAHPELRNAQVRQAFSLAIDRKQIADVAYSGYATPAATFLPAANHAWQDPSIKAPAVNAAQANALLDGLGYRRGAGGVRVANGKPMQYEIEMSTSEHGIQRTFETIQSGLAKIGVTVRPRLVDFTTLTSETQGPPYKAMLSIQNNSAFPDPDFMASLGTCAQYGAFNRSGYCSKEYDRIYAQTVATLDESKRKQVMDRLQQLFARDLPFVPLVSVDVLGANHAAWSGFSPTLWGMAVSKAPFVDPRRGG